MTGEARLLELHVKNLALIEAADVEFGGGLNILTGETGAGKSILIGSVNMALGQKMSRDSIRAGCEYASAELVFLVDGAVREALAALDVFPDEEGTLVISRRLSASRSISRINGETVTLGRLRQVTSLLIDVHGQHEHQSLLSPAKHREILDAYAKEETVPLLARIAEAYADFKRLEGELSGMTLDGAAGKREEDLLSFEVNEIEAAALREGEEEELLDEYRLIRNSREIAENLYEALSASDTDAAGRAASCVAAAADCDPRLAPVRDQFLDAEAILSDARRAVLEYLDQMTTDEEEFARIEERLSLLHSLEAKYGGTVGQVLKSLAARKERLLLLQNFEEIRSRTAAACAEAEKKLTELSDELSRVRHRAAGDFSERLAAQMADLNFLDVRFSVRFSRLPACTAAGFDEVEFMISTNPGEPVRPLGQIASGGELSRVMLAVKTVLADADEVPTLIFDEIDAGISGRTAQKVSEKLARISAARQVICITHLPQIAAMADAHFEIAKGAEDGTARTRVRRLEEEETINELARMLGGARITGAVMENAREMKRLAAQVRERIARERREPA